MRFALPGRLHCNVERVRLLDHRIAEQVVGLGPEADDVGASAEPVELHRGRYLGGRDRFAVVVRVEPELRRHAALVDGHLEPEVAVLEEAAAVRALGVSLFLAGAVAVRVVAARCMPVLVACRLPPTCGAPCREQREPEDAHPAPEGAAIHHRKPPSARTMSSGSPTKRSTSATAVWNATSAFRYWARAANSVRCASRTSRKPNFPSW